MGVLQFRVTLLHMTVTEYRSQVTELQCLDTVLHHLCVPVTEHLDLTKTRKKRRKRDVIAAATQRMNMEHPQCHTLLHPTQLQLHLIMLHHIILLVPTGEHLAATIKIRKRTHAPFIIGYKNLKYSSYQILLTMIFYLPKFFLNAMKL